MYHTKRVKGWRKILLKFGAHDVILKEVSTADDIWEVTKAAPKLRTRGNEEKIMNTTGFTSLVFGSPTRKMYNTGAVTSPANMMLAA